MFIFQKTTLFKFTKVNRFLQLSSVPWIERGLLRKCEDQGVWEELGSANEEKTKKEARGCITKGLHLREGSQEERQGETWRVTLVTLGERWWYV